MGIANKLVAAVLAFALSAPAAMAASGNKQIENEIRQMLKDPDSAKFGSLVKCSIPDNAWMGTLNAKNSYGGYTGMDEFYYERGKELTFFSTADEIEKLVFGARRTACHAEIKEDASSTTGQVAQSARAKSKRRPH